MDSDKSPLVPPVPPPPSYTEASKGVGGPTPPAYGATDGQGNTSNVTVVFGPPQAVPVVRSAPPMAPPKDYLIWSILTTVFCSFLFGLIAIIYSLKVSSAYQAGDYELALSASHTARTMNIIGMVVGTVVFVTVCILSAVGAAV